MPVDHLVAADEQDDHQAELRDALHQRPVPGLVVHLLDRRPAQPARRPVEQAELALSAANDFTTRVPVTFSSTIVAMSAVRAIIMNAIGNSFLRMLKPVKNTNGSVIT